MKFSEYVLSEGRKETLLNKYSDSFSLEQFNHLLNDEFIKNTNYKYADFILDRLQKSYNLTPGTTHIQDAIDVVKDFDRIKGNLEKKDINQYKTLSELNDVVSNYTSKSQEKKIDSDAVKIYEDSRILIVKPMTHKASCKYGAGTKWCTTQSSPGYYEKYTQGNDSLYYLIMKDFDISNKFYKIALHKTRNEEIWYDAQDTVLPPREVDILKVGIGKKANELINKDFGANLNKSLMVLFDENNKNHVVVEKNLYKSGKPLVFDFSNPHLSNEEGQFANMELKIYLGSGDDKILLEKGIAFINYKLDGNNLTTDIGFMPDDEFESPVNIESLWRGSFALRNFPLMVTADPGSFKRFTIILSSQIWREIQYDEELQKYVLGNKKTWNPNRIDYGFTFQRKGLINKLVDYLDSGKEGNAMDFLIDSEVVEKKIYPHGTVKYVGKKGFISPKGYFSSFFASAVRAGILKYERKNKKSILTKGPNFDDFKEGNLVAL